MAAAPRPGNATFSVSINPILVSGLPSIAALKAAISASGMSFLGASGLGAVFAFAADACEATD